MESFKMLLTTEQVREIEQKTGYVFKNKRLLDKAFTHSSYVNEHKDSVSNERLEFLGDRVLGLIISEHLFLNFAGDEGKLTEEFSSLVSKESLKQSIEILDVFKFLIPSKGFDFKDDIKPVSDLYEAILAAIYIDSGSDLQVCGEFVFKTLKKALKNFNYIGAVKEFCEKNHLELNAQEAGEFPDFIYKAELKGRTFEGRGKSKQDAKKDCTKKICEHFNLLKK